MKEALYYTKKDNKVVQCNLCPRQCIIAEGNLGVCKARKNIEGTLHSMVFANPVALHTDPIEKKPLYHFYPGSDVFSVGTAGCNLICQHCQNWQIARSTPSIDAERILPEKLVDLAIADDCTSIAYTYTEPTIFFEYVLETSKIAKARGIKNVIVSNGYINEQPLKELIPYLDAANIDLKGMSEDFYQKACLAELKPVLDTLKILAESDVWLEITLLMIPGLNDHPEDVEDICMWIKDNLGEDVPLHLSRFFPHYKMKDTLPTSVETLQQARDIARKYLNYVYIGNMPTESGENTYCPKCKKLLVGRSGFGILVNKIKNDGCACGEKIAGKWVD